MRPDNRSTLGCFIQAGLAVATAFLLLADAGIGLASGRGPWPLVLVSGLVTAVMALLYRVDLELRASIAVGFSLTVTGVIFLVQGAMFWGFTETCALTLLMIMCVRRCATRQAIAFAVLIGISMLLMAFRARPLLADVLWSMMMAILAGAAIGVGAYLRSVDNRRARAMVGARQSERLELARDLHDFVAHHITGIVVQTQAARYVAQTSPEQTAEMLANIEGAAVQALASMRRLVTVLRTDPSEGAATRPAGGLAQVDELVTGFARGGPPATLEIDPGLVHRELPPEVATTVHRVVQESLTNARKHAADATLVRVTVRERANGVEVAVRDDGKGTGRRMPRDATGGGFGIVGLAERVRTVGGHLHAGPRPEGGWEVVAWFAV
ncbi:MAG TPA: histidine kinase [Streptosporangiaceae bacterium]